MAEEHADIDFTNLDFLPEIPDEEIIYKTSEKPSFYPASEEAGSQQEMVAASQNGGSQAEVAGSQAPEEEKGGEEEQKEPVVEVEDVETPAADKSAELEGGEEDGGQMAMSIA